MSVDEERGTPYWARAAFSRGCSSQSRHLTASTYGRTTALKLMSWSPLGRNRNGVAVRFALLTTKWLSFTTPSGEPTPPTMRWLLSGNHSAQARASPWLIVTPGTDRIRPAASDQHEPRRRAEVKRTWHEGRQRRPVGREATTPVESPSERAVHRASRQRRRIGDLERAVSYLFAACGRPSDQAARGARRRVGTDDLPHLPNGAHTPGVGVPEGQRARVPQDLLRRRHDQDPIRGCWVGIYRGGSGRRGTNRWGLEGRARLARPPACIRQALQRWSRRRHGSRRVRRRPGYLGPASSSLRWPDRNAAPSGPRSDRPFEEESDTRIGPRKSHRPARPRRPSDRHRSGPRHVRRDH